MTPVRIVSSAASPVVQYYPSSARSLRRRNQSHRCGAEVLLFTIRLFHDDLLTVPLAFQTICAGQPTCALQEEELIFRVDL